MSSHHQGYVSKRDWHKRDKLVRLGKASYIPRKYYNGAEAAARAAGLIENV